jgi:hypothetical protein
VRALVLRFYRFTGFRSLVAILLACLIGVFALATGQSVRQQLGGLSWMRPFGRDGEIIVPKAASNGHVGAGLLTYNMTIEQVLAKAARAALGVETYGIVDQGVSFAPPGLTFMRASNDDWQLVAHRLIRRAHSIMLILPPGREIGEGFAWEIEQIVRYRMQSRVVLVLPPDDPDSPAHQEALIQAGVVLALLEGSGTRANLSRTATHEYQPALPANALIAKCSTEKSDTRTWVTLPGEPQPRMRRKKKMVVTDSTYLPCLIEALKETENELSDRSFAARYPRG